MNRARADVLLAEDNASDAELAADCLARIIDPRRIYRVRDGVEALDFLLGRGAYAERRNAPAVQLVLLDIKLPRVDGLKVLGQLRADPRTALVPVVMLTSSKVERDIAEAYRLGANGYVQKPVDFDRFRDVVACLGRFWLTINELAPESALGGGPS
jgi:two-component system response regulator